MYQKMNVWTSANGGRVEPHLQDTLRVILKELLHNRKFFFKSQQILHSKLCSLQN